jgi:Protein of unknown function (DUF3307)
MAGAMPGRIALGASGLLHFTSRLFAEGKVGAIDTLAPCTACGHGGMVMHLVTVTIAMLLIFQVKHYVADYLLQPGWVLKDKGDFRRPGGYVHAGVHALGSLPAFFVAGLGFMEIAAFAVAEFVIHFAIDHTKARLSRDSKSGPNTRAFWAMHGADQLMHQLTYAGLTYAAMALTTA